MRQPTSFALEFAPSSTNDRVNHSKISVTEEMRDQRVHQGDSADLSLERQEGHAHDQNTSGSVKLDDENSVNAMGAAYTASPSSQPEHESVFGESSIVSLISQIPGVSSQGRSLTHCSKPTAGSTSRRFDASNISQRLRRFSLPSRKDADHLLDQFWSWFHLFYPVIHFPSFLKAYESLWTREGLNPGALVSSRVGLGSQSCSPTIFHCAMHVIFALGCEFSNSVQPRDEDAADEFAERANQLLQFSLLDEDGLSVVQTLLLLAIYLQSTQHHQRCWGVTGLALRMAQGIGLHLDYDEATSGAIEIEMRRRVWHGCLLIDR